jgi:hypothetical protein
MPAAATAERQLHKPHVRTATEAAYHRVTAALPPEQRPRNEGERALVWRVVEIMVAAGGG